MPWKFFGRGEKGPPPSPEEESFRRDRAPGQAAATATAPVISAKAILVPADGSPASLEAVALACEFARRRRGRVYAIHVIEVPRALPLDAEMEVEAALGEEILRQAEEVARAAGHQLDGELLQAREAGQAVVDEAVSRGVELIVMGVEYRGSVGDLQMGRLPRYVLKNAPCEVWVVRRPPSEEGHS